MKVLQVPLAAAWDQGGLACSILPACSLLARHVPAKVAVTSDAVPVGLRLACSILALANLAAACKNSFPSKCQSVTSSRDDSMRCGTEVQIRQCCMHVDT